MAAITSYQLVGEKLGSYSIYGELRPKGSRKYEVLMIHKGELQVVGRKYKKKLGSIIYISIV